ncbi:MAG TPA: archaellin/type IV pilin N-terminal domain-containing protein [Methanomassiliicoccales archaeon]
MKMRTSWKKDKRAEMGVGTMIIFIAMVLVAAVAASVLISTANKVREQAQNTGDQAINNVASGFVVQDVTGTVDTSVNKYKNITDLTIQVRLQAGSPSVNMDLVSIQFISGSTNKMLTFVQGTENASKGVSYGANSTGPADTWITGNHVVQQGDLVTVAITGLTLGYSSAATIKIVPAYGSSNLISFVTPSFYNTAYVNLK